MFENLVFLFKYDISNVSPKITIGEQKWETNETYIKLYCLWNMSVFIWIMPYAFVLLQQWFLLNIRYWDKRFKRRFIKNHKDFLLLLLLFHELYYVHYYQGSHNVIHFQMFDSFISAIIYFLVPRL